MEIRCGDKPLSIRGTLSTTARIGTEIPLCGKQQLACAAVLPPVQFQRTNVEASSYEQVHCARCTLRLINTLSLLIKYGHRCRIQIHRSQYLAPLCPSNRHYLSRASIRPRVRVCQTSTPARSLAFGHTFCLSHIPASSPAGCDRAPNNRGRVGVSGSFSLKAIGSNTDHVEYALKVGCLWYISLL